MLLLLFVLSLLATASGCGVAEAGAWTPAILVDAARQNHTIDLRAAAFYTRCDDIVNIKVSYIIGTFETSGYTEWADYVTLPMITRAFGGEFEASGAVSLALSSADSDYRGGTVFTQTGGQFLRLLYTFSSSGGSQVIVHADVTYSR